jgi:hypothetical protein
MAGRAKKAAAKWLQELLSNGAQKATDVKEKAEDAGISDKALRRVREKLGIKPRKREFDGAWWWDLQGAQDAQDEGHLRQPSGDDLAVVEAERKAEAVRRAKVAMHPGANAALLIAGFSEHLEGLDVGVLMDHLKDGMNLRRPMIPRGSAGSPSTASSPRWPLAPIAAGLLRSWLPTTLAET